MKIGSLTVKVVEAFWANVEVPGSPNGCWLWTGSTSGGTGILTVNGKCETAQRVAFTLCRGPIPKGRTVAHRNGCPKLCVRPAHLNLGRFFKIVDNISKLSLSRERKRQLRKKARGLCVWPKCKHETATEYCEAHVIIRHERQRNLRGYVRRNRTKNEIHNRGNAVAGQSRAGVSCADREVIVSAPRQTNEVERRVPESEKARPNSGICILDCDSPSFPPSDFERQQCGCILCLQDLARNESK